MDDETEKTPLSSSHYLLMATSSNEPAKTASFQISGVFDDLEEAIAVVKELRIAGYTAHIYKYIEVE